MEDISSEFNRVLCESRVAAVRWTVEQMVDEEFSILDFYEKVITPALSSLHVMDKEGGSDIFQEHVQTATVQTILGLLHARVLEERQALPEPLSIIVACPQKETHDLGARMVADTLTLLGHEVIFTGPNTPDKAILAGAKAMRPSWIAISITNSVSVGRVKDLIALIKQTKPTVKVLVGGSALSSRPGLYKTLGADLYITSLYQLRDMARGES